jgi:hypothetical protein
MDCHPGNSKEDEMSTLLRLRASHLAAALIVLTSFAVSLDTVHGQAGGIGARGGQTGPSVPITTSPVTSIAPTTPVLPSNLNLSPQVTSSLLKGLDQSGAALRPGMGWLVSDLNHQGIHGRELSDVIHQLKPYREQGRLTFPQETGKVAPTPQQGSGSGLFPRIENRINTIEQGGPVFPRLQKGKGKGKN